MKSFRNMSSLAFCLSMLLAVCLSGSVASERNSLWGKKLKFTGRPCLWQLHPNTAVPALNELTVCILLRLKLSTQWTGFDYKAPGRRSVELGLQGTGKKGSVWLFGQKVSLTKDLKLNKWYSVCVTWSGRAQKLRVYINGDKELEASVASAPQHLAPNGTLTLGVSHYISNSKVQEENGKSLVGDIGLFRMWAREWSAEDMRKKSCSDGDVVSWDLRQWKYSCPPEPDSNLHCAWSLYAIKMWTFMDTSLRVGKCPVSLEGVTRNWLESIFPGQVSVRDIFVSSPRRSCHGVNNSAALHVQQPQASFTVPTCDKCFSCEVYVNVDPAGNVEVVQANITALLRQSYSSDFLNFTVDPYSIRVLPVESFPAVTKPTLILSTELTTTGPSESVPTQPYNISTTGEPLEVNETISPSESVPTQPYSISTTGEPLEVNETISPSESVPTQPYSISTTGEPLEVNETISPSESVPTQPYNISTTGEPLEVNETISPSESVPTQPYSISTTGEPLEINETISPSESVPTQPYSISTTGEPLEVNETISPSESVPTQPYNISTTGEPLEVNETISPSESVPTQPYSISTTGEPLEINETISPSESVPTQPYSISTTGEPLEVNETISPSESVPTQPYNISTTGEPLEVNETISPSESVPTQPYSISTTGEPLEINETISPSESVPTQPDDISTTAESLDVTITITADHFFRVNLNLTMTGSPINPKDVIETWLKDQLEMNRTMITLNLIIEEVKGRYMEQYNGQMISNGQQTEYNCYFHVQEFKFNTVDETEALIRAALKSNYTNESFTLQPNDVLVNRIEPKNCLEDTTYTIYGEYIWSEVFPQTNEEIGCQKPTSERASRLCKLDIETDQTSWSVPDMRNCKPVVKNITDLENITVTTDNVEEVVDMIQDLVNNQLGDNAALSSSDLDTVVDKLGEVVDASVVQPVVGAVVNIVADILLSKTDITPVSNIVLNLTERMGNNMDFEDESVSVTAPSLALSMANVDPGDYRGLTFGVFFTSPILNPKVFVNQSFESVPLLDTDATISLPPALHDLFLPGKDNKTRIQFQFYGTEELFQDPEISNGTQSSLSLNSYVVSASVNGSHVHNLKDKVVVTLNHQKPKQQQSGVRCVFWDFMKNAGQGGWNSGGCETHSISSSRTSCLCDHLTHFAVLLDVSRGDVSETDSQILTVISYLGCGISSIFLGITLLTYLAFEKLRQDNPSKILINLSAALLGLSMLFLLNSWLSSFSNYGLCIATAASMHYFLLASFTWMGLEAVQMYLALVKVFNIYIPFYILKFCAAGWGIPLVIVSIVLAIDKDVYGSVTPEEAKVGLQSTEQFCWLQNDVFFYVTVVAFFLVILLCNISVFIVVLFQIRRMRFNKSSANRRTSLQDLRAVASLTVLLGLTWSMGFFSFGPGRVAMLYLFCIFNSLQGFFIFLFHCLMKENVRKQWRIHLCCGRFRLGACSDCSRSVTASGGQPKKNILVNSDSVASVNTSTTRKISDSSTGKAPNHHQRV